MYRMFIAIFFTFSLTSCDRPSRDAYELLNLSDSTLYLSFINIYSGETMVTCEPHSFTEFYRAGAIGCENDPPPQGSTILPSLKIFRHGWQEIKLNYNNSDHWLFRRQDGKCSTRFHTLELSNEDL